MLARSRLPSDDSSWWVPATANRLDRHLTIPATVCLATATRASNRNASALIALMGNHFQGVENLGTGVAPEGKTHATAEGLFSRDL